MMYEMPFVFNNMTLMFFIGYILIVVVLYCLVCPRKSKKWALVILTFLLIVALIISIVLTYEFQYLWW